MREFRGFRVEHQRPHRRALDLIAWPADTATLSAPPPGGPGGRDPLPPERRHLRVAADYEDAYGYRLPAAGM